MLVRSLKPKANLLVTACTTTGKQPEPPEPAQISIAEAQRAALINSLPGVYSNFDQSHGSDGNIPTVDLVVHCHHGPRSSQAVMFLRGNGFERARNLTGGIDAWSQIVDPSVPRY